MDTEMAAYDEVSAMIAHEQGTLDWDGTIELFQHLIDSGTVWQLQGSYGRMADSLIKNGYCHYPAGAFGQVIEEAENEDHE